MSNFVKVTSKNEIQDNEVKAFLIGEHQICVARVGKKYFVFDEICSHQYASLEEGWLEDYTIECPMHGAQFDIRTGEALTLPAVEDMKIHKVEIRGEDIFVKLD
jgi:3-phenylpropionate/trans-cinnamate dioxygenase ferredoxin component